MHLPASWTPGRAPPTGSGRDADEQYVGTGFADVLNGAAGNDRLWGEGGADQMTGGLGNDIFYVDNAGDKTFEAAGQGSDTVLTTASYALAAGQDIENFATTSVAGTAAINLTGNELAQRIDGNNGVNVINGGGGNDLLFGDGGNDTLIGGAGSGHAGRRARQRHLRAGERRRQASSTAAASTRSPRRSAAASPATRPSRT